MDKMAWRAVLRIQIQAKHFLCHIQARVNVGSFVAASSSGPTGSIRMEAAAGNSMGQGLTKQGPRRMGRPFIPPAVSQGQMGLFAPTNQFSSHCTFPMGLGVDFLPKHGFDVGSRQKGNRFQSRKHPAQHPSNEW